MAFKNSLDNVKKICGIVTEEKNKDNAIIDQIVSSAAKTYKSWLKSSIGKFRRLDFMDQDEIIFHDIMNFFDEYSDDLLKQYNMTYNELMTFFRNNAMVITSRIISELT